MLAYGLELGATASYPLCKQGVRVVLPHPGHGAEETSLEAFTLVDRAGVEDDLEGTATKSALITCDSP